MLKFIKLISIVLLGFIFSKCANIVAPTGGPKDIVAPSIKSQYPSQKTTNFKDKKVIIEFDEDVTLNNINQELQITPSIGNAYKVNTKKKVVTLEFTEPLKDNTTYKINFNNGIKDLTEGNKVKDMTVIFSTGNTLDSLYIKGTIKNITNNKQVDAIIGLYISNDTLDIFKHKPYIYTKAIAGNYSLENIKEGKYELVAFEDANNNLVVDKNEKIGFINNSLMINKSVNELNFSIINNKIVDSLKITNTYVNGNKIDIDVNNGLSKIAVKSISNISYTVDKSFKHINVYNLDSYKDSLELNIQLEDSNMNVINKKLKFKTEEKKNKKENASVNPASGSKIIVDKDKIEVNFSKPIRDLKRNNLLKLYLDNKPAKYLNINTDYTVNEYNDRITITNNFNAKDSIKIETDKANLFTVNNDSVYNVKIKYLVIDETETGLIKGKIETDKNSFIIQLLNDKYTVIEEIRNNKDYTFNKLRPGKYNIRVIDDVNNNGVWDMGNYNKRTQPESVSYYTEEITLKENWEILDINIIVK